MTEFLSRETRKLEVRLTEFIKEEAEFIEELKTCLDKFKKMNTQLELMKPLINSKSVKELIHLRQEATKALSNVLIKKSIVEHEQSHLLESYGALLLALEETFQTLNSFSNIEGKSDV